MSFIPKGITSTEWVKARRIAIANSGGVCSWCGQPLQPNAPKRSAMTTSVDHIKPRAEFGHLDLATVRHMFLGQHNLSVMHMKCNSAKAAREPTLATRQQIPTTNSMEWAEQSLRISDEGKVAS